ncbi:MAG TPA: hypothetical protein VFS96_09240 [Nitrolancea sp.]|nr:hypothetical protein [Nitrolancea sp.]
MRGYDPEGTVTDLTVAQTSQRPGWLRRLVGDGLLPPAPPTLSVWTLLLILGFLAAWRAAILIFSYIFDHLGSGTCGVGVPWPLSYSACWDTQWYQVIAAQGYSYTPGAASSVAFFPLFPLLIRYADRILPGGDILAALVVVHLALAAAVIYIYQLVRLDFPDLIAWRTLFYLLAFPSALFFSVVYPESVFLLGLAGALYHARRGQWIRAGLFGIVASATKLIGLIVPVVLVVELLAQGALNWRRPRPMLGVILSPLGALGYLAWLQFHFGDFRVFFVAESYWMRESFDPVILLGVKRLMDDLSGLAFYPLTITPLPSIFLLMDTTLLLLFIVAGIVLWLRVRPSYGALVLTAALILTFSGNPQSLTRYLVVLFPVFILVGQIPWEPVRNAISLFSILGLGLITFSFVNGIWAG